MPSLRRRSIPLLATVFLAAAVLAGCAGRARPALDPTLANELRQAWQDAFNRADTAALVALYAEDTILLPPGGTMLTGGRTAVSETVGRMMDDRTLRLSTLHQRLEGGLGHVQGTWQARPRNGRGAPASGRYLMLFQRETDGRWRIRYHVWTQDRDPAPDRTDVQPGT